MGQQFTVIVVADAVIVDVLVAKEMRRSRNEMVTCSSNQNLFSRNVL